MRAPAIALLGALAVVAATGPARAEAPQASERDTEKEAVRLFTRGSELFLARRYGEALEALRASHDLVPSPNSGLLIARCLRALGDSIDAAQTYADVEAEARRRAATDPKYAPTASAAAAEGAALRATLGALRVHVANAPAGTRLEVGGVPAALPAEGEVQLWRFPGTTTVRVRPPAGPEQAREVKLAAGKETRVDFEIAAVPEAAPPPQPPQPPPATPPVAPPADDTAPGAGRWAWPAAIGSGAVAVAGLAMFAGFGLSAKSTYDTLERRCGPSSCGPADRAEADAGQRKQAIANVSLAVGVAGALAAGIFTYVALGPGTAQRAPVNVVIGPASLAVVRRFE